MKTSEMLMVTVRYSNVLTAPGYLLPTSAVSHDEEDSENVKMTLK
jgi:hypothetical protein